MATVYEVSDDIINGSDKALHKKARSALAVLALGILSESAATANHAIRARWAARILNQGTGFADRRARLALALDAGIRAGYEADARTDAAVQAVLAAALDSIIAESLG